MEQVLIWPAQYPMLLKGLVEQNGAFILDALEQWPSCQTSTDDQGVSTTVLPPLFYLIWLRPIEPFEACNYQHIDDYDDKQREYVGMLIQQVQASNMPLQEFTQMLIQRLGQYSNIQMQIDCDFCSFARLLIEKEGFAILTWLIESGMSFDAESLCQLWNTEQQELQQAIVNHIDTCSSDQQQAKQIATEKLESGESTYGLLKALCEDDEGVQKQLEQALLSQLRQEQVKQSIVLNLVNQGAIGTAKDEQGRTSLMLAAEKGFVSVVENLLEHHPADELDHRGRNLMHFAAASNSAPLIELLFAKGVDATLLDSQGESPFRVAMREQALEAKRAFQNHGIIELSQDAKFAKIKTVHLLYAFTAIIMPLQIFLFFTELVSDKTLATLATTGLSLVLFGLARRKRKNPLYPTISTPWSLWGVKALAWVSVGVQVLFSALVIITVINLRLG
ncbi:ankyrin repeat domain-containing protein [Pseudoalteromonas sp. T1lg65]|uniref:ankyrin repeat domain-containing protein n=1 Tax=Pseudoalteromonas sp. T1lg65 TaxID=2077101 RepID=UPI003F7AD28F